MTLEEIANKVFDIAEELDVPHMAVGAIAAGTYGIPRATKDIDLPYVEKWCGEHGSLPRLHAILEAMPEF